MLIDDIHTFVKFLKSEGQNIYHTPEELDNVINRACLDLFRQEEKIFEQQQIITDTLGALKVKYAPTLDVGGTYALPSDYVRMTNLAFDVDSITTAPYLVADEFTYCDNDYDASADTPTALSGLEYPINLVIDSEWVLKQKSRFLPITEEEPIARIYGRSLEVLPKTVAPIMYYLKKPTVGVWNYTTSADGYSTIFNPTGSVDVDFPEIAHNEIIEKVISLLGVPLRDGVLTQFEQMQKRNNNER